MNQSSMQRYEEIPRSRADHSCSIEAWLFPLPAEILLMQGLLEQLNQNQRNAPSADPEGLQSSNVPHGSLLL
jgi:hypothetical protein